jgi:hypothetical protein
MDLINLNKPLNKLIISKILLDGNYKADIYKFKEIIPYIYAIRTNNRGQIFLEFVTEVDMGFDVMARDTGRAFISRSVWNLLCYGDLGNFINLSCELYNENQRYLSYLMGHLPNHYNDIIEVQYREGQKYFIYYLVEFIAGSKENLYSKIHNISSNKMEAFRTMQGEIFNSLTYNMKRNEKYDMKISGKSSYISHMDEYTFFEFYDRYRNI